MDNDFKIFDGKNFSDLSKEIYENSKLKKTQIDLLSSRGTWLHTRY